MGGDGADCAGQRGPACPAWAIVGKGPLLEIRGTRDCTKAQNLQRAGLARGGARGGRQGAPAPEGCVPGHGSCPWPAEPGQPGQFNLSFRNMQEQATIRRAGEIARLSMAQLGLARVPRLPNQGAHVHPKKARPATVLFRRPFRLFRLLLASHWKAQRYRGTQAPRVKLSQWDCGCSPTAQLSCHTFHWPLTDQVSGRARCLDECVAPHFPIITPRMQNHSSILRWHRRSCDLGVCCALCPGTVAYLPASTEYRGCADDCEASPPLNDGHDDDDVDVGSRRQIPAQDINPQRTT